MTSPSTTATFRTHSLTIDLPLDIADALTETHEDGLEGAAVAALQLWLKIGTKHLNIAQGYAVANGISQHAAIKKAIIKVLDEKAPRVEATIPRKKLMAERNADVYRRAMLGVKRKQLAEDYGLSEIRVHQIIAQGKKNDPKNSPVNKAKTAEILQDWDDHPEL
jgi:Mor family transcriptional regulator